MACIPGVKKVYGKVGAATEAASSFRVSASGISKSSARRFSSSWCSLVAPTMTLPTPGRLATQFCVLLYHLFDGDRRFSELRRLAAPISERTLSLQLKRLEADGFVTRHVHTAKPPLTVTYRLTALGESTGPVVRAIAQWGREVAEEYRRIKGG